MELQYITKPCCSMSDLEYEQCSELFSNNYGKYSGVDSKEKGQQIRMSPSLYKRLYGHNPNMFVSLCYDGSLLLGQAFFLRKNIKDKGICSWVTQLVVHNKYRKRKIGSKLLQSAWGFSNYYAWGLATANALTLKTLESVTWREINISEMSQNIELIEEIMEEIPYANKSGISIKSRECQVFTNFYPELELVNHEDEFKIYAKRLGKIKPGNEWLAFTFSDQKMVYTEEKFQKFMEFSEKQLNEIYSRMGMSEQPWTKGTEKEVDYIMSKFSNREIKSVLDIGCGHGRHAIEFSKRGVETVVGVDFSEANIAVAKKKSIEEKQASSFIIGDARKIRLGNKYDLVLCLYDVVGSFRDNEDNLRILRTVKSHLNNGSIAVISVMNMELTEIIAKNKVSLKKNPEALLGLKASNTMAESGNVFLSEYFLINEDDGLVYRKEQFESDGMMSAEYLVADKRYRMEELKSILENLGFNIIDSRYVQAGKWDMPLESTDSRAKEILFIVS